MGGKGGVRERGGNDREVRGGVRERVLLTFRPRFMPFPASNFVLLP